jgi:hypothetical protein
VVGSHDSLVRCFGQIVAFEGSIADTFLVNQFNGRQEEIVKEPPFLAVEVIEKWDNLGVV